jgi:hypothetical protein
MTFGGNGAVTVGGDIGSEKNPGGFSANFDKVCSSSLYSKYSD